MAFLRYSAMTREIDTNKQAITRATTYDEQSTSSSHYVKRKRLQITSRKNHKRIRTMIRSLTCAWGSRVATTNKQRQVNDLVIKELNIK